MANVYNALSKMWVIDDDDILSLKTKTDANSALLPVIVRMIRYVPAATGQGVQFQTCNINGTPTVDIAADVYSVTNTYRITDDSAGAVFNGASVGDWAHITTSSSGNNLGWYLIDAVDGSKQYIDVAYGTRPLTNDTNETYTIKIYTPETALIIVSPTSGAGAEVVTEVVDFGSRGQCFENLAMYGISGGYAQILIQ